MKRTQAHLLARKRLNNTVGSAGNLTADEQRVLAKGYIAQANKLRLLRRQVVQLSQRLLTQ